MSRVLPLLILLVLLACHRGDPLEKTCAAERFEVRSKTVTDTKTHFVWERKPPVETMTYAAAQQHCASIGMTLPQSLSLAELMTTGPSAQEPFDTCAFPSTSSDAAPDDSFGSGLYWSGTSNALPLIGKALGEDPDSRVILFGRGELSHANQTESHRVRCWRDR